jgi:lipopolysaccharide/colanic/teichoic acid biosynthesis glycosyltransferase
MVLPEPEPAVRGQRIFTARTVKRQLDILISLISLVVASPLLAALAVLVKLDSPGPFLYWGPRAGKDGNAFPCCKIRTMVVGADALKAKLLWRNQRQGPIFKLDDDPRVTSVGRWLRRYSLDEIPQFWNVLKGEMSLVGPRPHPVDECESYEAWHRKRLEVTPGLTGLWQVTARLDPSFQRNVQLDLEYIERWSLSLDLQILGRTAAVVLAGTGR